MSTLQTNLQKIETFSHAPLAFSQKQIVSFHFSIHCIEYGTNCSKIFWLVGHLFDQSCWGKGANHIFRLEKLDVKSWSSLIQKTSLTLVTLMTCWLENRHLKVPRACRKCATLQVSKIRNNPSCMNLFMYLCLRSTKLPSNSKNLCAKIESTSLFLGNSLAPVVVFRCDQNEKLKHN